MATTRENRTLVVDFKDCDRYQQLIQNGRAFIEFVTLFILELGFKLHHKPGCPGGCKLTRHSYYMRIRSGVPLAMRIRQGLYGQGIAALWIIAAGVSHR